VEAPLGITSKITIFSMKTSHIIGIMGIAIAIAVVISTYFDSSTYDTFRQATMKSELTYVSVQLDREKAMQYDPFKNANLFTFYGKDKEGRECKVLFNNTKPQDFERSEEIVLTGKMQKGEFHAYKIQMKCPSKYTNNKLEITEVSARKS